MRRIAGIMFLCVIFDGHARMTVVTHDDSDDTVWLSIFFYPSIFFCLSIFLYPSIFLLCDNFQFYDNFAVLRWLLPNSGDGALCFAREDGGGYYCIFFECVIFCPSKLFSFVPPSPRDPQRSPFPHFFPRWYCRSGIPTIEGVVRRTVFSLSLISCLEVAWCGIVFIPTASKVCLVRIFFAFQFFRLPIFRWDGKWMDFTQSMLWARADIFIGFDLQEIARADLNVLCDRILLKYHDLLMFFVFPVGIFIEILGLFFVPCLFYLRKFCSKSWLGPILKWANNVGRFLTVKMCARIRSYFSEFSRRVICL